MYFFMKGKEQHLDLRGDFILTHNDKLVKTRTKSAAPVKVVNADYACVKNGSFFARVVITFKIIAFVWGRSEALTPKNTNLNKPYVNAPPKHGMYHCDKHGGYGFQSDCMKCNPPKDFADRCIHLHENKNYCIHINNLDNACTGYDSCKDYEVEYTCPEIPPKQPVKPVG